MYLDQRGFVRACCMNDSQLLGNVADARLIDIWRGEPAQELRRAMERHDFGLGCDYCAWQVERDRASTAFARWFDKLPVDSAMPEWPRQLELAISNTCNLQCAMCNGEWSSSIRSRRERLPPLEKVYDERFFDDLRDFIPHLKQVKLLGGEPFLAAETLRVLDLLVEVGTDATIHVTTNGTQWTPRAERVLDALPIDIAVSIDAATRATYESIREGASWDDLTRNLDLFAEKARQRGTWLSITFCLMTLNWHEFAEFCWMADDRGINCDVNTVMQPDHLSLFKLPAPELAEVVDGLDAIDAQHGARFGPSRRVWTAELDRLRRHLTDRSVGRTITNVDTHAPDTTMRSTFERSVQVHLATKGGDDPVEGRPADPAPRAPVAHDGPGHGDG
ncbi:MAG: radical SAM protein [Acidimicrobiales bacterium]|nr:radical SAM protein [Acidimicrobiales bacterium]